MTRPRLWAFLAVGLPVLAAVIANLPSVDLTYRLRAGPKILAGEANQVSGMPKVTRESGAASRRALFDHRAAQ